MIPYRVGLGVGVRWGGGAVMVGGTCGGQVGGQLLHVYYIQ